MWKAQVPIFVLVRRGISRLSQEPMDAAPSVGAERDAQATESYEASVPSTLYNTN